MNWRRLNNALHRDLGYLCFGLTVVYAISGIAVNHVHQWNPSYEVTREKVSVDLPDDLAQGTNEELAVEVLRQLGLPGPPKSLHRSGNREMRIFVGRDVITVDLDSKLADWEKVASRPVLHQLNFLHLNHPKKWWTLFADVYAVALALLAITGLFVLKGKKGIRGRGAWLTSAGIILPIIFLFLYF